MAKKETFEKAWAKIVAKAWTDEAFKKKLLQNPEKVLKEMGVAFPADVKLEMHEQKENELHLVLPARPQKTLSEQELKQIAAGRSAFASCPACGAVGFMGDD